MKNYLDLFLDEFSSEGTRNNYRSTILTMLNTIGKDVGDITKLDLLEYKKTLKNLASATQAQKIMCLKSYFRFLFENEIIDSNPAVRLSAPKIEHKPKDALTTDEAIGMMAYANPREKAIIAVLLNTGVRVQELIDMQLADFLKDPTEMSLRTKGGKYRTIYFNDDTIVLINQYLKVRKMGCDNLFVSNQGTPLSECALNRTWKKLASKSHLDKHVTNHSFRSTYVTTIAMNYGIVIAQQAVNHANIATTRIYVRGIDDNVKNAIRSLKVC